MVFHGWRRCSRWWRRSSGCWRPTHPDDGLGRRHEQHARDSRRRVLLFRRLNVGHGLDDRYRDRAPKPASRAQRPRSSCRARSCRPPRTATARTGSAALGENLNQPNVTDPATMMHGRRDAQCRSTPSALKGFAFDVEAGTDGTVPVPLPAQPSASTSKTRATSTVPRPPRASSPARTAITFTDLVTKCYATPPGPSADTAKSALIKISWQVVTSPTSTVPFDFCISNVRALQ